MVFISLYMRGGFSDIQEEKDYFNCQVCIPENMHMLLFICLPELK